VPSAWPRTPALAACGALALACASPHSPEPALPAALAAAESVYADLRALRDRYEVTSALGRQEFPLRQGHDSLRTSLDRRLAEVDSVTLAPADRHAFEIMRRTLGRDLTPLGTDSAVPLRPDAAPACAYDPARVAAGPGDLDSLRERIYACYAWAQQHVLLGADTLDRLTLLGEVRHAVDPEQRRRLFLALGPVWRSVNGEDGEESPYRRLIRLETRHRTAARPSADSGATLGVSPDTVERWLLRILEAWRAATPDSMAEPWDWLYAAGASDRALGPHIPLDRLQRLSDSVFLGLGADVRALNVHYDLAPREGKTPVAFTTFGARARRRDGRWTRAEPWVFATYRDGGLDNLNELLHETGHAVHTAAIHTRPAFADWPDSDPFSEAIGDFVALDVYEPAWQARWLGDSVPLAVGLKGRYAGIVLDVAWALFESRMLRDPGADPNAVWTAITGEYLRIRPHPELSWWAMRGQLVDAPGYMLNYAFGAVLIAAIRERTIRLHGPFAAGDPSWYAWVAPRLFRFGLERPSRQVLSEFLGGEVTAEPILRDMARMGGGRR
jgi:hypothetical protein